MHIQTHILRCVAAIVLSATAPGLSGLQAATTDHAHQRLVADPALTLRELVDRTLSRGPAIGELESQAREANAWDSHASNWLSAAPSLALRYQTDRFNRNDGLEEYEAGLLLHLWRWGEKSATAAFATTLDRETEATRAALRWEVAGAVRQALWRVATAEIDHSMAERSAALAERLKAKVERAQELGDLPLGDVLIARSNHLEAVNTLIEKEALLLDAERAFAILTQDSVRPPFAAEPKSAVTELPQDHVLIRWLNSQINRASAARDRVEKSSRGSPALLLGPKREQAPNDPQQHDSIGVTLSFPFATGSHAAPQIAAADRELAGVVAERDRQLRRLQLMFHEAVHELEVATAQLQAAARSTELAAQQIEMGSTAFESGELNLLNLLQIQRTALAAERHAALLKADLNRSIAQYNQAVGDTP